MRWNACHAHVNASRIAAAGFAVLSIVEVSTIISASVGGHAFSNFLGPAITLLAAMGFFAAASQWGPGLVAASFALRLLREVLVIPDAFRISGIATSFQVLLVAYILTLVLATAGAVGWATRRAGWGIPILRIALLTGAIALATTWVAAGAPAIGALVVLGTGAVFILTALSIPRAPPQANAA